MNEAKHTPGPWEYDYGRYIRKEDTGGTIALMCESDGHVDPEHATSMPLEANARLIAAAPDLLEALQDLSISASESGYSGIVLDRARTAIAKAKGCTR